MAFERNRNWQKTCLICLENDKVFLRQVRSWQKYYKIPADSTFCLSEGDLPRRYLKGNYRSLQPGCLKDVDLKTQLIIFGHGNPSVVSSNYFGPSELADRLAFWGLKQVGLLSVRACAVGAGGYLETLKDNLASKAIGVGWLIGYRGAAGAVKRKFAFIEVPLILPPHWTFHGLLPIPVPKPVTILTGLPADKVGMRTSLISLHLSYWLKTFVFPFRLLKVPETFRSKIVQGNAATTMSRDEVLKGRVLPGLMLSEIAKDKKLLAANGASPQDAVRARKQRFRAR